MASLDVQKAFDTLQHQSLLDKLYGMGVAGPWWNLKKDMYDGMLSRVTWEGKTSENALQVKQGNGQGKTTSPDDYITYLTPLLDLIYQSGAGFHIGSIGIPSPTCADDMLAMATDMGDAQSLMSLISYYANAEHYVIHPEKSVIVPYHVKSKAELEHLIETRPIQMNQKGVPIKKEMTHLGITRNNSQPNANIEDRISCARKTLYALMGSGLHGLNGLPVAVSMHLYRTFVLTRALYGLEATIPSKTALQELEKFNKRNLRSILGLPERTATAALYILTGSTQMIHMVHIQTLKYLLALLASGITREVVLRQHATKSDKSASWVVYARSLLQTYELPTIMDLYNDPPTKLRWKKMVTEAVNREATRMITEEAQLKSTLKYLNPAVTPCCAHDAVAHIENPFQVTRANAKIRLMVDVYPLGAVRRRMKQVNTDICQLCDSQDTEDRVHFLTKCRAMGEIREKYLSRIISTVHTPTEARIMSSPRLLTGLILDPDHPDIREELIVYQHQRPLLERTTRDYIFALHITRSQMIENMV